MQYQDQNNEIIFTQEFFIEAGGGKTYFDPDDNELAAELQTPYQSKIDDCVVTRREQGIYDVKVFFPKNQSGVILYLTWLQEGLRKAIGYNINTVYASGKFDVTPQNIGDLQLSQHIHDNYEVLQGFTDVDGVLRYEGVPVGGGGVWGSITGTLSNQTDLQAALDGKQATGDYATNTDLTNGLAGKVDVIAGKGLSTNDLTDELKTAYDEAITDSHTHSNKIALDAVSGTNTGDQDLSGLVPTSRTVNGKALTSDITLSASDVGAEPANANIQGHISSTSNPHGVTANQVGAHATGADIDAGGYKLKNFDADVLTDSGTSITLSATHRGKILHTTSASAVTVTIPDTCESGFTCTVRQEGAGQITFAAGSNMTLRNRQSHTKSAGQYSGVCVSVEGTGYVYIQGDTAA